MRARIIAILLVVLIFLTACSDKNTNASVKSTLYEGDSDFTQNIKESDEFIKVAENGGYELLVKGSTTEVAVRALNSGKIWYSQPCSRESDTVAFGTYVESLNSPLSFSYVDKKTVTYTVNAYADSIALGQYTFEKKENGLKINYLLGEPPKKYVAPTIVSVERMEEILSKLDFADQLQLKTKYRLFSIKDMDETSKAVYTEKYPILKQRDVYIISGSTLGEQKIPDFLLETIQEYFLKAGYTYEQMLKDNEENLVTEDNEDDFSISVSLEYTLEDGNLICRIPIDSLKYDENVMTVLEMTVLPFFGAAGENENGYIFVPDGCGALIYFNSDKTGINAYEKEIYGPDLTIAASTTDYSDLSQIYLPVFGVKSDNQAFLGIIESGAANADICAQVSGKDTNYNQIYTKYRLRESVVETNSVLNLSGNSVYQKSNFSYDIQIRYMFLEDEQADYVGMAHSYAGYMENNGLLFDNEVKDGLMLHLSAIGAVPYTDNILGMPVLASKSMTSYSQVIEILDKYLDENISNINFSYTGWFNKGVNGTVADKIKLVSSLGSKKDFTELSDYMEKNNVGFYPEAELQYVSNTVGFNVNKKASRTLSNMISYKYQYSLATLTSIKDKRIAIVAPSYLSKMAKGFLSDFEDYGIKGVYLSSLGTDLNSDFNEKNPVYRQNSAEKNEEQLKLFNEKGYSVAVSGANDYTLKYAQLVLKIPTCSSGNYMLDEDVPFYQILLHGRIPYAAEALNQSSDYSRDVLKLIEYGASPSFEFIYEDNFELKETNTSYYSVNFDSWYDESVTLYKELDSVYGDCSDELILSHKICGSGVYITEYSNGVKIYVNYGSSPAKIEGVTVQSGGYSVVKGDTE